MNELSFAIVTGIVGGLLTTIFVVMFSLIWKKILEPFYQDLLYQDARIEGRWYGRCDYYDKQASNDQLVIIHADKPNYYSIDVFRTGHNISGIMNCESGWEQGRTYILKGTFRNLMLSLTYEPNDSASMERASMTLMLKNNGRTLKGFASMYMDEFDWVSPGKMIWTKEHAEGHLLTGEKSIKREKGEYTTIIHNEGFDT